jgi:hypothetical protein
MKEPEFKKEPGPATHTHMVDFVKKYAAGGHIHNMDMCKKHSAGHMMEHEKVQKMCGGGMSKKR